MNEEKIRISGMDRKKSLEFAFDYAVKEKIFSSAKEAERILRRLWYGQL
jgi:hypothetical protein